MLQIAIWGIAFMLIVKALDVLHQQGIAVAAGHRGSPIVAYLTIVLALLFAFVLFASASSQAGSMPSTPSFGGN